MILMYHKIHMEALVNSYIDIEEVDRQMARLLDYDVVHYANRWFNWP